MAEIVLGMWTSHGPTLSTTPEQWTLRVAADKQSKVMHFRCKTWQFDELVELRKGEDLARQCNLEERTRRHRRCQDAIKIMADKFAEVAPDVVVIMGNDQRELFIDTVIPAFTVFAGETFYNEPAAPEQAAMMPPGIHEAESGHNPPEYTEYPGLPEFGDTVIRNLIAAEFDIARSTVLPRHPDHWSSGIPHAFGFPYRMIMRDRPVPGLPIITNTFFPPNQPTAKRCFDMGQVVGKTIRDWDTDLRVAVFGSGGMSHFVIDEEFDNRFFEAFKKRDAAALKKIEECYFQSGTSELKNWIAAAGILFDTELDGDVVDYIPCYRSEAGTCTANGFVYWA